MQLQGPQFNPGDGCSRMMIYRKWRIVAPLLPDSEAPRAFKRRFEKRFDRFDRSGSKPWAPTATVQSKGRSVSLSRDIKIAHCATTFARFGRSCDFEGASGKANRSVWFEPQASEALV